MIKQPVFLVGARCCGKTTVGKLLAEQWGWCFVDTDHWLTDKAKMTVEQLVAQHGWPAFRQQESEALQAVSAPCTIVATGGGMVLSEANRQFMRQAGQVVWLFVPAAVLVARLNACSEQGQRPTLTGKPIACEMEEVLTTREPLYRQAAHHRVDASLPSRQVMTAISLLLDKNR